MSLVSEAPLDPVLRDCTVDAILRERVDQDSSALAIDAGEESLTFGELVRAAERFAAVLIEHGIGPGDRVAIWLPNSTVWAITQAAAAFAGAQCVLMSTRASQQEAAYVIGNSRARLIVAADSFLGRDYAQRAVDIVLGHGIDAKVLTVGLTSHDIPEPRSPHDLPGSAPDDAAVWLYTSGTTGRPKGTSITHRVWTNNAALTAQRWGLNAEDRMYSPGPLFFVFGSLAGLMGAFTTGASFHTSTTFSADIAIERMRETHATWFMGVPTMWTDLLGHDAPTALPCLRGGTWGGAPFPNLGLERALDRHGLDMRAIYGLSEAPSITTTPGDATMTQRLDSVGQPGALIEVKIVDEVGQEVAHGTPGQILTRGYHTTTGYLNNAEATSALFSDDWLRTGDLGSMDTDGYLTISGRLTDMIIVGGSNVYAREIEDAILAIDGVDRVGVVGAPHERLGEVPVAWVQTNRSSITAPAVIAECRRTLAAYKVPATVHIVDSIPLTATGKIHKADLRNRGRSTAETVG